MDFETSRLALFEQYGAPMQSRRVQDRTGRTLYALEGGEGEPVVFLHGGGGDACQWAPLIAALGNGHRWIAADRPGHGLSGPISYRPATYRAEAAAFVEDLLDGLGIEKATLVGNSMGAYFAFAFALAHPERVTRVIATGAPAGLDRWVPPMMRVLALPVLGRLLDRIQPPPTPQSMRDTVFSMLVADPAGVPDALLEVGIQASLEPGFPEAWHSLLESCLTPLGFRKSLMIRDEVATLDVETHFAWGTVDSFAPPTSGEELLWSMPRATLTRIEGAGHLPWLDRLEETAAVVRQALGAASPALRVAGGTA